MVSLVGEILRRRSMGRINPQLEGTRHVSARLSACGRSRSVAWRNEHQVDVSYQQLLLSARDLESCALLLSGLRLCRLVRPERLRSTVQGRAKSWHYLSGGLALSGAVRPRSEQACYDRGMGDGRISYRPW